MARSLLETNQDTPTGTTQSQPQPPSSDTLIETHQANPQTQDINICEANLPDECNAAPPLETDTTTTATPDEKTGLEHLDGLPATPSEDIAEETKDTDLNNVQTTSHSDQPEPSERLEQEENVAQKNSPPSPDLSAADQDTTENVVKELPVCEEIPLAEQDSVIQPDHLPESLQTRLTSTSEQETTETYPESNTTPQEEPAANSLVKLSFQRFAANQVDPDLDDISTPSTPSPSPPPSPVVEAAAAAAAAITPEPKDKNNKEQAKDLPPLCLDQGQAEQTTTITSPPPMERLVKVSTTVNDQASHTSPGDVLHDHQIEDVRPPKILLAESKHTPEANSDATLPAPAVNVSTPQTPQKRPSKLPILRKSTSTPTPGFLSKKTTEASAAATLHAELPTVRPASPSVSRTRKDLRGSKVPVRKESQGSQSPQGSQPPVRKVARSSSLTRTANAAAATAVASKTVVAGKPKMREADVPMVSIGEDEDDDKMPRPISLKEKRERQAKREEQVKFWRVREEREAREARSAARRRLMEPKRQVVKDPKDVKDAKDTKDTKDAKHIKDTRREQASSAAAKKGVKFNLRRNRVIEITPKSVDT
ncbi:hypothetical protein DFQ28_000153 [Apophysomyces sp. BC1034]|nr:hypothetical protein DFQ30_009801 [Apophysomyces sp. BC1015]KAG0184088.1 hypothetical protein DFQ28_000153 [Apophysomyces sp. BC1034]